MELVSKSTMLLKRKPFSVPEETPRANWFQRAGCVLLDFFLALLPGIVIAALGELFVGEEALNALFGLEGKTFSDGSPVTWFPVVFYLCFAFYRPLAQALFHQTIGERILQIYVANSARTQLTMEQTLKRHLCPAIFWLCVAFQFHLPEDLWPPFAFLAIVVWIFGSFRAFKGDRRTLLDLFSGAYVYKQTNTP